MARTVAQIQQHILDTVAADAVLSTSFTSKSKRAIYRLWAFISAVAMALHEQLWDAYRDELEAKIDAAPPGSAPWVHDKVLKFQYSEDDPQIIQLINLAPKYPVNNSALRIVTRCSVSTDINNNVTVKVAKREPPEKFNISEIDALASYMSIIGVGGVTYNVISLDADRLYVKAQIYFSGLFSAVIKSNVISAINNFLANLALDNFGGEIKVSALERVILAVPGVNDVILEHVWPRQADKPFGGGTFLVVSNQLAGRLWPMVAGYAIAEDTPGNTLDDSLTFIPL